MSKTIVASVNFSCQWGTPSTMYLMMPLPEKSRRVSPINGLFVGRFLIRQMEFFKRCWFMRMWPIKGMTLPLLGRVDILYGDSSIPFEYIQAMWQLLAKISLLASSINPNKSILFCQCIRTGTQLFVNNYQI